MKPRALVVTLLAIGALLPTLARGDAPSGQYGYFDETSTTIYDKGTGLTWQRDGTTNALTRSAALAYCAGLSLNGNTKPWRLPTYKELLTLVDEVPHGDVIDGTETHVAIDRNAFGSINLVVFTKPALMWTSSLYAPDTSKGWQVDFSDGQAAVISVGSSAYVRCVTNEVL